MFTNPEHRFDLPRQHAALVAAFFLLIAAPALATVYFTQPGNPGNNTYPAAPTLLFSMNEDGTGGFTLLGSITLNGSPIGVASIAADANADLFGFEFVLGQGSRLIGIDPTTLASSVIGDGTFVPVQLTGAGFDRNGRLFVMVEENLSLQEFHIPTLSLVGPPITVPSAGNTTGGDVAFDLNDNCYWIGTFTNNTATPLYTCDLQAGTFTLVGALQTAGPFDAGGVVSTPGLAFSLNNADCAEVLLAADGRAIDEAGIIDLTVSPPTFHHTATTGINISWWNQPDLAGFPSVLGVPACNFCGDGTLDPGEECDDGNNDAGDGCSPACLIEEIGEFGCTFTQGYWKNHNRFRHNRNQQIPWPIDEETLLCGQTWLDILHTSPKGDAWYILAHQVIAAALNVANGASVPSEVAEAADIADALLQTCSIAAEDHQFAIALAEVLASYNEGEIGPGHCD